MRATLGLFDVISSIISIALSEFDSMDLDKRCINIGLQNIVRGCIEAFPVVFVTAMMVCPLALAILGSVLTNVSVN